MKFALYILTTSSALAACAVSNNKVTSIPTTTQSDTSKSKTQDRLAKRWEAANTSTQNPNYTKQWTPSTTNFIASNGLLSATLHTQTYSPIDDQSGVTIQNSYPKGGVYTDGHGVRFGYRIFWSRIVNETSTPLEMTVRFPADSFPVLPLPGSYLKLFLPSDTMTHDKVIISGYGAVESLKSFATDGFSKPTRIQRTINPHEEMLFTIGAAFYNADGITRAELVMKDQQFFYKISVVGEFECALIPCGYLVVKK
jgi:hypothetical protein